MVDALYRISSLVGHVDDPREALEIVIDEIMRVLPAASASIDLINPDTGLLEIEVMRGLPEKGKKLHLRLGEGVTGWVALHGKALRLGDVQTDPRYICVREDVRSELAVPMQDRGAIIGVVNIDSPEPHAFTSEHLKILTLLTNEATKAVGRLWLINQLKRNTEQLQALVNIGRRLVSKRERRELLNSIVGEGQRLMRCRLCAIFLLEDEPRRLKLEALSGAKHTSAYAETLMLDESAVGTALQWQKQIEVLDLRRSEEHHFVPVAQREGLVSLLCSPLTIEGEAIGVLNVYTDAQHRFNNEEKKIFAALAGQAALAIHNARLYARVFTTEETLRRTERLNTLGLLTAEIAHEIRNPLTVIKLLFDSLDLDFPVDDPRRKDASIIKDKLDQLEGIVTRVLSFGRSSRGLHSRYDLRTIIEDTLHLVRLKMHQSGVKVIYESFPDALPVEASKTQLQQAALNLILNAQQAMPGGGRLEVRLQKEILQGQPVATATFADTGPGIAEHFRHRIFDSFLSNRSDGSGLGLSIVKRILEGHRGGVEVLDSSPRGTTMRFWLPLV